MLNELRDQIAQLTYALDKATAENRQLKAKLEEWGISDFPPIVLERKDVSPPYTVGRGDGFRLTLHEPQADGSVTDTVLAEIDIDAPCTIDSATIFRFKDALGFKHAYVGAIGQRSRK